jgi:hypothetical protein
MSLASRWSVLVVSILTSLVLSPAALADEPELPLPGQIGSTDVILNGLPAKRLGIGAQCRPDGPAGWRPVLRRRR